MIGPTPRFGVARGGRVNHGATSPVGRFVAQRGVETSESPHAPLFSSILKDEYGRRQGRHVLFDRSRTG